MQLLKLSAKVALYQILYLFHYLCLLALVAPCFADSLSIKINCQDKSNFTLFNPVPRECLRELSTDRPDITESAYSLDPGHFQLEMSFFDYAYTGGAEDYKEYSFSPINIKMGLTHNVDLQFVFTPYIIGQLDDQVTGHQTSNGFSDDTQLRLKVNLWGNDSPGSAMAIMPFIKFPWGSREFSNDHVEGGLIMPLALELANQWGLGLMLEVDAVYDQADRDYAVDFVHTATLGHDISLIPNLAGSIEYVGIAPFGSNNTDYQVVLSTGLTYALTDASVLDLGARSGLSGEAADLNLFFGMSYRY